MNDRLKKMWEQQHAFSTLHYDVGEMNESTREAKTRELALALHHEVSKLVSAVNFRGHLEKTNPPCREKVLYEAVDAIRYGMAILNLWDYDDDDFANAWDDKDHYLTQQHRLQELTWSGQPVVIWDIDDVLADFREGFSHWVCTTKGVHVDASSPEYFFIEQLAKTDYSSLALYDEFIKTRGMATLPANDAVEVLNRLHDEGVWTHLVTARPGHNLICRYDTYHWLRDAGVKFDGLDFTGEKLAFVSRTKYAINDCIVACVDDGPNHVHSYINHGFQTFMPNKPYNANIMPNAYLTRYTHSDELYDGLMRQVRSKR